MGVGWYATRNVSIELHLIDADSGNTYTVVMEVHFTPEQEARLAEVAGRVGKNAAEVVQETVARMLEDEARFVEAVKIGFASLDRGEFVEHEEVKARVDRLLRS